MKTEGRGSEHDLSSFKFRTAGDPVWVCYVRMLERFLPMHPLRMNFSHSDTFIETNLPYVLAGTLFCGSPGGHVVNSVRSSNHVG